MGLVVLLTALTGVAIGGLAWREQRARSRALIDAAMAQAARLTAAHAHRLLQDAAVVHRLLDVQTATAAEGHALTPAQEAARP